MKPFSAALLTPEQLHELAGRAIQSWRQFKELGASLLSGDAGEKMRQRDELFEAIQESLRFCAVNAALLKDASLLSSLLQWIESTDVLERSTTPHSTIITKSLSALLQSGAPSREDVLFMARHSNDEMRAAVARGLQMPTSKEQEIMLSLAADPVATVRNAAKERLKGLHEISWWRGKFSQDPTTLLSPEEAERLKPALERISVIADTPLGPKSGKPLIEELTLHAAQLPEVLRVDLSSQLLSDLDATRYTTLEPLGAVLLDCADGVSTLLRLLHRWAERGDPYGVGENIATMIKRLSPERAKAVCIELLAFAQLVDDQQRASQEKNTHLEAALAVGKGWPTTIDATPVLNALLTLPKIEKGQIVVDYILSNLAKVFERVDPSPFIARVIDAKLLGYSGSWSRISWAMESLLRRVSPELLRPAVEQALQSDDPDLLQWGLSRSLTASYQTIEIPDVLVKKLLAEPKYRSLLIASPELRRRALPQLRLELRAGQLGFLDALLVMVSINDLYGGLLDTPMALSPERQQQDRQRRREEVGEFKGEEEWQTPPTTEEWSRYRQLREQHLSTTPQDWQEAILILPQGAYSLEDRLFLQRAIAFWRSSDSSATGDDLAHVLSLDPVASDLAVLDEIWGRTHPARRYKIEQFQQNARRTLGIPAEISRPKGEKSNEWMDEDD